MTTSRIVRGTKIRIFVCFCGFVVILGLVACYNNTLTQLNQSEKAVELCHQQQDNLSTQLQVISDYKIRLEKALQTEKADHAKSNTSYQQIVKEEKLKNEKDAQDAKIRFNSLQQRYNLLQTEHDDFKEKTSKTHQDQIDEINELHVKLKQLGDELKDVQNSKEKLKTDYLNLQIENDDLKRQMEGQEQFKMGNENKTNFLQKENLALKREIESLKDNQPEHRDSIPEQIILNEVNKNEERPQLEQNVLVLPVPNNESHQLMKSSSSSSTAKQSSQGSLNGARPLVVPTMTPKTKENKVPEGVLPAPKLPESEKNNDNEIPNVDIVDNRYKNQIEEEKEKKHEELEKENVANEVFEGQNVPDDGLGFGDPIKQAENQNFNKKHIDNLAGNDYKERIEGMDEAEDDDQDEYGDHLGGHKEPAVRN